MTPATTGPAISVSRSGRLRTTRRTGRRPISSVEEDASERIKAESSSSVYVKRNRRSPPSPSSSLDTLPLESALFAVDANGIENNNPTCSELRRLPPFDAPLPSSETSDVIRPDITVPKQLNVRRTTGLHSSASKQRTKPIEASANLPQQLASAEVIQNPPSPCGSRPNSTTLLACPVDLEYDPRDCTSPDPPEDDGEESHDSGHDETYSTRFWKRAIVGGESPASYNSDDDEEYAPSVDSGQDWRGEIRIGEEYQALVPPYASSHSRDESLLSWDTRRIESECSQLWQPGKLSEAEVVRFERLFAQAVAFPRPNDKTVDDEEALFLLMRCDYDPDEALQRLRFRTVLPSECDV
ncbi:unnamed protein product [Dicrocoelium dendriticum]|nr:unnamed protein product [Dicrocoelium dendriticum]